MRTIYAARVAGAGLSLISALFLLSLLFTQGGCTASQRGTSLMNLEATDTQAIANAMPVNIWESAGAWARAVALPGSE
jgi:hypothetical protein